jgi:hypothetical protein
MLCSDCGIALPLTPEALTVMPSVEPMAVPRAMPVMEPAFVSLEPNPFDFDALSSTERPTEEAPNEFSLGEGPMRAWRRVYRGMGLVTLATLMGPAICPVLLLLPIVIVLVGAIGLITVEDIQQWMLPLLGMLLWFMPLAIAGVRTAGTGLCVAAPSEAGVKGLAVACLALNAILLLGGAAAFMLNIAGRLSNNPAFEVFAWISLVLYLCLTMVEVIVFLVYLLQVGNALHRPELKREVIRFFVWLGVWIGCQGVMLLLLAIIGATIWLYVLNVILLVSFLIRYLLLLRTARGVLMRLFRLNLQTG